MRFFLFSFLKVYKVISWFVSLFLVIISFHSPSLPSSMDMLDTCHSGSTTFDFLNWSFRSNLTCALCSIPKEENKRLSFFLFSTFTVKLSSHFRIRATDSNQVTPLTAYPPPLSKKGRYLWRLVLTVSKQQIFK